MLLLGVTALLLVYRPFNTPAEEPETCNCRILTSISAYNGEKSLGALVVVAQDNIADPYPYRPVYGCTDTPYRAV